MKRKLFYKIIGNCSWKPFSMWTVVKGKRARETFEICVFKHRQTLPLQYIALGSSQCNQKTWKLKENVNNFTE